MTTALDHLSAQLGGSQSPVGGLTQSRVMREIAQRSGIAIQRDIAPSLRLSAGTVSKAVAHLRHLDFIEDADAEAARGRGRPTVPVKWSRQQVSIGVRIIDRDNLPAELVGTVVDLAGTPLPGCETPRRLALRRDAQSDSKRLLEQLERFVRQLAEDGAVAAVGATVLGVGVSMGGHIDHGVLRLSYNTGWGAHDDWWSDRDEFDLRAELEAALEIPVVLDNDANAVAVRLSLTSRPADTYGVVVVLRDGVGAAVVLGGDMWRGPNGLVGEIGHLDAGNLQSTPRRTRPAVSVCRCGEPNHIEAFASPRAILNRSNTGDLPRLASRPPRETSVADLFEEGGRALGRGVVSMLSWVNPQKVIVYAPPELLSDDASQAGSLYQEALRNEVRHAFSTGRDTPLELVSMAHRDMDDLGAVSSAFLVLGRLIDMVAKAH